MGGEAMGLCCLPASDSAAQAKATGATRICSYITGCAGILCDEH